MNEYNDYYMLAKPPFGAGRALCITFNALLGLLFGWMLCGVPSYWSETGTWSWVNTFIAALLVIFAAAPFTAAALIALFSRPAWMRGLQWFVFGELLILATTFFVFAILPDKDAVEGIAVSYMCFFVSGFIAALASIALAVALWVKRFTLAHE